MAEQHFAPVMYRDPVFKMHEDVASTYALKPDWPSATKFNQVYPPLDPTGTAFFVLFLNMKNAKKRTND